MSGFHRSLIRCAPRVTAAVAAALVSVLPATRAAAQGTPGVIHVNARATGATNGRSWADAYRDLATGLRMASPGDELWVAAGTYVPGFSPGDSFILLPGVAVFGGFAGTETNRVDRNWTNNLTILSGDLNGDRSALSYHVVQGADAAVLDGFVITLGDATQLGAGGGGMQNATVSPVVRNCTFADNSGTSGGAIYNDASLAVISNCVFRNNLAAPPAVGGPAVGGAVVNRSGAPLIVDCQFLSNVSTNGDGGAIYSAGSSRASIRRCTFKRNRALNAGGAIYSDCSGGSGDAVEVSDSVFCANVAWSGGAVYQLEGAPRVSNCVFADNQAGLGSGYGGAIVNVDYSSGPGAQVLDCLFARNAACYGAAVYNETSSARILRSTFCGNVATLDGVGGAVKNLGDAAPQILNCTFAGNRAEGWGIGGALANEGGAFTAVSNCTFVGNAASSGGAVFNSVAAPEFVNCILWTNRADTGPAICNDNMSTSVVKHCDIQGGIGGIANLYLSDVVDQGGNIADDPRFVGPIAYTWNGASSYDRDACRTTLRCAGAGWTRDALAGKFVQPDAAAPAQYRIESNDADTLAVWGDVTSEAVTGRVFVVHDYHLQSPGGHWESGRRAWVNDPVLSPCVDAGDPASPWRNEPTPNGGRVNIGADGNTAEASKSLSATRYVSTVGSHVAPFTSWATAAADIQAAIDAAGDGDTVIVSNGVYASGGAPYTLDGGSLTCRVMIAKSVVVRSVNGPDVTVIRGAGPRGPGAVRCARVGSGASLIGFTLTNGTVFTSGAGVDQAGGGAYCAGSGAMVSNCVIAGNAATYGGGAYQGYLYSCVLRGNSSGTTGGGASQAQLRNCKLIGNTAADGGGANMGGLYNCLLTGNSARSTGGGANGSALYNCTVVENSAGSGGGGAQGGSINNSILYFNTALSSPNYSSGARLAYSCATPLPPGTGNTVLDPAFVDTAIGDYRLTSASPCVDAGTNQPWMAGAKDLDGNPRIAWGTVDMGAYESTTLDPGPVSAGLISWWPAEGTAEDAAGSNDGALVGGVTYDAGREGQAFRFYGGTDSVVVPDSPSLRLSNQFTIAAWINPNTTNDDTRGDGRGIVSKVGGVGGNNGYQFLVTRRTLAGGFNSPGGSWASGYWFATPSDQPVAAGAWTHVAWTYDQSAVLLYLNGTMASSNAIGPHAVATSAADLRISGDDNGNVFFDGLIDEVRIYDRAISPAEVRLLAGVTPPSVDNDGGASNITATAATLNGNLTSTGGAPASVRIYWGPTDGGTVQTNWANVTNLGIRSVDPFSADLGSLTSGTLYYYRCWASNAAGVAWAPASTTFMTASAPVIFTQPASQAVTKGAQAVFSVYATGTGTLTYRWKKGGAIVGGATNAALVINPVQYGDAGDYTVDVTDSGGTTTSGTAGLSVNSPVAGDLDFGFFTNTTVDGAVCAIAVQADGKVLIGGDFTIVNGASRGYVARLNANGTTDYTFGNGLAGANWDVLSVALQSDGKVVIGGGFITVNGASRGYVARLNADGTLDTTFGNGLAGANDWVLSVAVQSDGKVLIGGGFTTVNGASRGRIARLNADGTLDTAFGNGLAGADGDVRSVALQSDGKVVIGGGFTTVNGALRAHVARLNADGTLDTAFGNGLAGANDWVRSVAVQSDGKVVIGGEFTTVSGASRGHVARLNADGTLDMTFGNGLAGANDWVQSVAVQSDGKVLIGGWFTTVNGASRGRIARLNADGTLDTTFGNGLAGANDTVLSVALQSDGKVLIGGEFTTVNGASRGHVARLNADGTLDTTFGNGLAGANSYVSSVALQSDGKVVIGGNFTRVNGTSRRCVARLNADGTLDTTFGNGLAAADGEVRSVALQSDGKVLIGGYFTTVNGASRGCVARLNADGTLDTTFGNGLTGANNLVYSVAVQSDGKVVIGGSLTTVNGIPRAYFARLEGESATALFSLTLSAGTLTPAFSAGTLAYAATVLNTVTNITVMATCVDTDSTVQVRVNGGSYSVVTSGSPSSALALNPGTNTIDLLVTAADSSAQTYTIAVTQQLAPPSVANAAATDVTASNAALNGNLFSEGDATGTVVRIYWGTTDGGTVEGAWGSVVSMGVCGVGEFAANVTGLSPNTVCHYRCWASNAAGVAWAPASAMFRTLLGTASLVVAGFPAPHGVSTPYGYGTNAVPVGTTVTNTVNSPADVGSGRRYLCTGWTGAGDVPAGGTGNVVRFTIRSDSVLTWNWKQQVMLSTWAGPNGSVTAPDGWHDLGRTGVVVTATPSNGFRFAGWTGTLSSDANPLLLTLDQPHALDALFLATNIGVEVWTRPHAGTGANDLGAGVALDSKGDVIVAGYISRPVRSATDTGRNAIVLKYDRMGTLLWSNEVDTLTTYSDDQFVDVAVDRQDNIVAVGTISGEFTGYTLGSYHQACLIRKYTPAGVLIRQSIFHDGADSAWQGWGSVAMQSDDTFLVGGTSFGAWNGPEQHWAMAKFSASLDLEPGSLVHYDYATGSGAYQYPDMLTGVALYPDGSWVAVGVRGISRGRNEWHVRRYTAAGTLSWQSTFSYANRVTRPEAVVIDSAGDVVVAGYGQSAAGDYDAIVAKYAGATGATRWITPVSRAGGRSEVLYALALTPNDDLLAGGYDTFADGVVRWVLHRFDPLGNRMAAQTWMTPRHSVIYGLVQRDGWVGLTGTENNPTDGDIRTTLITWNPLDAWRVSLRVVGQPGPHGNPAPYGYGLHTNILRDAWIVDRVTDPEYVTPDTRWTCLGWTLRDAAGPVTNGLPAHVAFRAGTNLDLAWHWTNEFRLIVAAGTGGTVNSNVVSGWYPTGRGVGGIAAMPSAGHGFSGWTGDVPAANTNDNPLTVTMDRPRQIVARFTLIPSPHHFVALAGAHRAPFTRWEDAATNIQDAVDAAEPGDSVWVADGRYRTGGAVTPDFALSNRVVVAKPIRLASVNGPATTWIVGAGPNGPDAVRCAYVGSGAQMIGFTLTNGHTRAADAVYFETCGGGVFMEPDAVAANCVFIKNACSSRGGGAFGGELRACLLKWNSAEDRGGAAEDTRLVGCTVHGNWGNYAGGLRGCVAYDCAIDRNWTPHGGGGADACTLVRCTVSRNAAESGGGTWHCQLTNCTLRANTATLVGSGAAGGTLYGCLVVGNSAAGAGGGADAATLVNCTVTGNTAPVGSGVSEATLANSIVYGNAGTGGTNHDASAFTYSCTAPFADGMGNVAVDPQFVDAAATNLHLRPTSPCVNAGLNDDWMASAVDLDGNPRIAADVVDMGAYEYAGAAPVALTVASAFGSPAPPAGRHVHAAGAVLTCAMPDSVIVLRPGATQVVCQGWAGTGSVPAAPPAGGAVTNTGPFALNMDSSIAWLWRTYVHLTANAEPGGAIYTGVSWQPSWETWFAHGVQTPVWASPPYGYRFAQWTGDVPPGTEQNHPLALAMDRVRTITATFKSPIASVTPENGPLAGGNLVTIVGREPFVNEVQSIVSVDLCGVRAEIVGHNATQVVVRAGAGTTAGIGDVTIVSSSETAFRRIGAYTYDPAEPPPAKPAWLWATDGAYTDRVVLAWSPVSRATGYDLFRHTTSNRTAAARIGALAGVTHVDTAVAPGQRYYYWVAATAPGAVGPDSDPDAGYALTGVSKIYYQAYAAKGGTQIYRCDLDGANEEPLFHDPTGATNRFRPAVGPDGRHIAYVRNEGPCRWSVCISDVDGRGERPVIASGTDYGIRSVNWRPDGATLVYVEATTNWPFFGAGARDGYLYRIGTNGAGRTLLHEEGNAFTLGRPEYDYDKHYAASSPDGARICLARNELYWYAWPQNLFVCNADGTNLRRLTQHPDGENNKVFRCVFSPSGREIVYQHGADYGSPYMPRIRAVNTDGTGDRQVVGENSLAPTFTRDGSRVICSVQRSGLWTLASVRPDGSGLQALTQSPAMDRTFPSHGIVQVAPPPPVQGRIRCVIQPAAVAAAGARWRLTSGPDTAWHASGEVSALLDASAGPFAVTFSDVASWVRPPDQTGIVIRGGTSVVEAVYGVVHGFVRGVIHPRAAVAAGARWRLTAGADTAWHAAGEVSAPLNVAAGPYTVEFADVAGWNTPPSVAGLDVRPGTSTVEVTWGSQGTSLVMGGTFQMGGVQGSDGRAVTLRSFMIDAREVTVAEFEAFCLDTGRSMPAAPRWGWTRRDLPVVNVTWDEAAAFAAWMGKRLPTEAEFEYVMRAGGLANTLYPWGDTFLATAANCLGQVGAPTPAGTYAAGPLGLFDLTGNVWEWCSDWYEPLLSGPADNPTGPASGDHKVMRGGSWVSTERKLTCSSRHFMLPGARYSDLGFRCAMNVGPAKDADAGSGTGGLQTVPGNVPPNDTVPETLDEQPLLPHPLVELGPWAGAWDLGQGWRWMDWFGYFAAGPEPWIYHAEHAWMYAVGTSAASLWLWTPDLGWLWTADEVYPFLYSAARQTWLFYAKDSRGPRWFFNWAAQRWEAR